MTLMQPKGVEEKRYISEAADQSQSMQGFGGDASRIKALVHQCETKSRRKTHRKSTGEETAQIPRRGEGDLFTVDLP